MVGSDGSETKESDSDSTLNKSDGSANDDDCKKEEAEDHHHHHSQEQAEEEEEEAKGRQDQWEATIDGTSGRTYYYHRETRETRWEHPNHTGTTAETSPSVLDNTAKEGAKPALKGILKKTSATATSTARDSSTTPSIARSNINDTSNAHSSSGMSASARMQQRYEREAAKQQEQQQRSELRPTLTGAANKNNPKTLYPDRRALEAIEQHRHSKTHLHLQQENDVHHPNDNDNSSPSLVTGVVAKQSSSVVSKLPPRISSTSSMSSALPVPATATKSATSHSRQQRELEKIRAASAPTPAAKFVPPAPLSTSSSSSLVKPTATSPSRSRLVAEMSKMEQQRDRDGGPSLFRATSSSSSFSSKIGRNAAVTATKNSSNSSNSINAGYPNRSQQRFPQNNTTMKKPPPNQNYHHHRQQRELQKMTAHSSNNKKKSPSATSLSAQLQQRQEQEASKMMMNDDGPTLAPYISSQAQRRPRPSVLESETSKSIDSNGRVVVGRPATAAAGIGPTATTMNNSSGNVNGPCDESGNGNFTNTFNTDFESPAMQAASGILVVPGAFAMAGIDASEDDDSDCDYEDYHRGDSSGSDGDEMEGGVGGRYSYNCNAEGNRRPSTETELVEYPNSNRQHSSYTGENSAGNQPLTIEAVLHEEAPVLDDAVVVLDLDDDHRGGGILDPKAKRRLRLVQVCVTCFSIAAVVMVTVSAVSFRNSIPPGFNNIFALQGWEQVGDDLWGPTNDPYTLFGSAVAISGDGSRLAIAAPGFDNEGSLNVGQIQIFDEHTQAQQQEEGEDQLKTDEIATATRLTNFRATAKLLGPAGGSSKPEASLTMSSDGSTIAVGYPEHREAGGIVQIFRFDEEWYLETTLTLSGSGGDTNIDLNFASWFGHAVDLSSDGSILAVGAPRMKTKGGQPGGGMVRIYQRQLFDTQTSAATASNSNSNSSRWKRLGDDLIGQNVVGLDDADGDDTVGYFGWSVAISSQQRGGNNLALYVAIGSPISQLERGHVDLFEWSTQRFWRQVTLTAPVDAVFPLSEKENQIYNQPLSLHGLQRLSRFGAALDLTSSPLYIEDSSIVTTSTVVVAVGARGTAFDPGQVFVFRFKVSQNENNDSSWVLLKDKESDSNANSTAIVTTRLLASGEHAGEGFGASISLSESGNTLAVGGPQFDGKNARSGAGSGSTGRVQVWNYHYPKNENTNDSNAASTKHRWAGVGTWKQEGSSLVDVGDSESIEFLRNGSSTDTPIISMGNPPDANSLALGYSVALSSSGSRILAGAPWTTYDGIIAQAGDALVYDSTTSFAQSNTNGEVQIPSNLHIAPPSRAPINALTLLTGRLRAKSPTIAPVDNATLPQTLPIPNAVRTEGPTP